MAKTSDWMHMPHHQASKFKQLHEDKRTTYFLFLRYILLYIHNITSFYGSSCANNGKDALITPGTLPILLLHHRSSVSFARLTLHYALTYAHAANLTHSRASGSEN
eukprot:1193519-Prorocentrum_minimum.AAC.1